MAPRRLFHPFRCIRRSFSSSITPEEAGRRAQQLAQKRPHQWTSSSSYSLETLLSHAGVQTTSFDSPKNNVPLSPAIHFASTYTRPADGVYPVLGGSAYTRVDNPTRQLFEMEMTKLELHSYKSEWDEAKSLSCAFSSGMMATSGIILAHTAPLVVLLPEDVYHGVPTVLNDVFHRFQVTTRQVHMHQLQATLEEYKETDSNILLWMESPSNPQTQVIDIASTCSLVKATCPSITTVVDTTLAPLQQPLLLGADMVLQSVTKYIGGHSDVLCGVVTVHPSRVHDLLPRLQTVHTSVGGVASPMDCWLALRGMRTLAIRYERQCANALILAQFIEKQASSVERVYYPGLASHEQHPIAKRQMNGHYGGVLSVEMKSEAHAMAFAGAMTTIVRATSLGGTETLIEHRASIEPAGRVVSPPGLLRISVGLEDVNDLIHDMEQALSIMKEVCDDGR